MDCASLGATTNPIPFPRRSGRRMEVAGWAKTCEGSVIDGMKVVMVAAAKKSQMDDSSATAVLKRK